MELNDNALAVLVSALVLLTLAFITGSLIFYAVSGAMMAFIAWDFYRLRRALASLNDGLSVSTWLSRSEVPPGGSVACALKAEYAGAPGLRLSLKPFISGPDTLETVLGRIEMRRGEGRTVSMDVIPETPGDHSVGQVKACVSSLFFKGEADAGEKRLLKVRIPIGMSSLQHRICHNKIYSRTFYSVAESRGGSDFSRVREHATGDDIKNIDWALSSRSQRLVVREYESERILPSYFLVDLGGQPQTTKAGVALPLAIASSLINLHLADGERAGLACFSRSKVEYHLKQGSGRGHFRSISDALSRLSMIDEGMAQGSSTYVSASELYEVGRILESEMGDGTLKPILEETLRNYSANCNYDGFMQAIQAAIRASKEPCHLIILTGLSMGLLSLMNGIRLARYHGHFVSVILFDSSGGLDVERKALLESALRKLRAQSIKASLLLNPDTPESVLYEGRIPVRPRWHVGR
ncbi:hypothetical protein Mtc_1414 [Methanocella conradii HZ254]|uniref:DUF58 domain-containing protein n=1 Tax=Methanocella conradii (strain DSM 24694 / JCM 17849 / CGMCC 1.5162 / HZ254) TaxID=1041930 RepID=H8I4I9_METCZ|nr:DUF58 domain-containing protein [Methanocella conradii]AFD00168.1 hypothetical protein Mtc_1414 [Methanocella conradii HZ254]